MAEGLDVIPKGQIAQDEEITSNQTKKPGNMKKVYKGKCKKEECILLKFVQNSSRKPANAADKTWLDMYVNELGVLKQLGKLSDHGNYIPRIWGIYINGDEQTFIQEYAPKRSVKLLLKDPALTAAHRVQVTICMAAAMSFLEQARMTHNDCSCKNFLVTRFQEGSPEQTQAKITDFKLAQALPANQDFIDKKQLQATRFCSPETVKDCRLSSRSDTWFLGAAIWELFNDCKAPWIRLDKDSVKPRLLDLANDGLEVDLAEDFPPGPGQPNYVTQAMLCCLRVVDANRIDFATLQERLEKQLIPPPEVDVFAGAAIETSLELSAAGGGPTSPLSAGPGAPGSPEARMSGRLSAAGQINRLSSGDKLGNTTSTVQTAQQFVPEDVTDTVNTLKIVPLNNDADGMLRSKVIKQYLQSPQALKTLGPETVSIMAQEVNEAEIREVYLMDLIKRMKDDVSRPRPEGQMVQAARGPVGGGGGRLSALEQQFDEYKTDQRIKALERQFADFQDREVQRPPQMQDPLSQMQAKDLAEFAEFRAAQFADYQAYKQRFQETVAGRRGLDNTLRYFTPTPTPIAAMPTMPAIMSAPISLPAGISTAGTPGVSLAAPPTAPCTTIPLASAPADWRLPTGSGPVSAAASVAGGFAPYAPAHAVYYSPQAAAYDDELTSLEGSRARRASGSAASRSPRPLGMGYQRGYVPGSRSGVAPYAYAVSVPPTPPDAFSQPNFAIRDNEPIANPVSRVTSSPPALLDRSLPSSQSRDDAAVFFAPPRAQYPPRRAVSAQARPPPQVANWQQR